MEIAFILIALVFSAFFSGSEIAFVAANRLRVEVFARRGGMVGGLVSGFLEKPATFLTTTLVGNNLALVLYSTLVALSLEAPLQAFFGDLLGMPGAADVLALTVQTIIASVVVLIIGEVIPKSIMREVANRAVFWLAVPLRVTYFLLLPLILISRWTATGLMKLAGIDADSFSDFIRRDFELLIEESKRSGELDLDEEESILVSNVFAMGSIRLKESMVPRTDIIALDETSSIDELRTAFVETGHSKIPIYRENIDKIVGVAFAYDLFSNPKSIEDIIRPATFAPETKLSKELLQEFLETNTSIAIVIDEYGGTAGLVTSEDLLEEIFGDIQDEFDVAENMLRVLSDDAVIASGRLEIDQLDEDTDLKLPEGDFETVAGYLLERLGTIPKVRDEFELDGFRFVILRATANRIDLVRISKVPPVEAVATPS